MADTTSQRDLTKFSKPFAVEIRNTDEMAADSQYAAEALEAHKREGLELAVRARWIAMGVTAIFLLFVNPKLEIIYYLAILALLSLNAWVIQRVGRVGKSRAELTLIFLDLLVMTVGMVAPNPLSDESYPLAIHYRWDNFQYFFILLAAGTLAFSWRTVAAIGVWTVAMWLTGLGLAWWFAMPFPGLTDASYQAFGDYPELAEMMDPNSFAFKLRIQEALVFLLVAFILAVSSRRFSRLLMDNAGLERERANLSRYFSPNVVAQLSQNDDPLKQVRSQDVAVLFIDIVGFTSMTAGQDPREVIELLRAFHGRMEREVFRHRGTLDKYLGDGLMATFGTPMAGEQDATDALGCAIAMREALEQWNRERRRKGQVELRAGIGIHYGETVLGDIGANRLEYAVIGTAVNVAARLENMTRQLGADIVMSDALKAQVLAENRDASLLEGFALHDGQKVRGVADPMRLWAI